MQRKLKFTSAILTMEPTHIMYQIQPKTVQGENDKANIEI